MKKILFALCAALCFCSLVSAQTTAGDLILTKEGKQIHAKVTKVGINEVEYLPANYLDGPVHVIAKSDITTIFYSNGTQEEFDSLQDASSAYVESHADGRERTYVLQGGVMEFAQKHYYLDGVQIPKHVAGDLICASSYLGTSFWKKANRNEVWGWILFACAMACFCEAALEVSIYEPLLSIKSLSCGVAFSVGSGICLSRVRPARAMAVGHYNVDVAKSRRTDLSLNLIPVQSGVGLALRF